MAIKAIPTVFQGVEFRSRLEARVAATLTGMGCRWEYEPEGFVLDDGTKYLPDFRVAGCYIEVKPYSRTPDDSKIGKMAQSDQAVRCYLVQDRAWESDLDDAFGDGSNYLHVLRVRGVGFRSSAVWAACPRCRLVGPWTIGDETPCRTCGESSTTEEWWSHHYLGDHFGRAGGRRFISRVWPTLPQYKNGRFTWRDRFNKGVM